MFVCRGLCLVILNAMKNLSNEILRHEPQDDRVSGIKKAARVSRFDIKYVQSD